MKKIIFLLILLVNCNIYTGLDINYPDTVDEAIDFVINKIKYQKDMIDYWQSPQETYYKRTGDCEDKAILLMEYMQKLGESTSLIVGKTNIAVYGLHAFIKHKGILICSTSGKRYKQIAYIKTEYDYATVMWLCGAWLK